MDAVNQSLFSLEWQLTAWWLVLPALVFALLSFRSGRRSLQVIEDRGLRLKLMILRSVALLSVLILLLQPIGVHKRIEKRKRSLLVLLDGSPSMKSGRLAQGLAFLESQRSDLGRLSEKYHVRALLFSADTLLDSVAGLPVTTLTSFREATRLQEALDKWKDNEPAGVILLSDGVFRDRFSSRAALDLPLFEKGAAQSATRFYPLLSMENKREKQNIALIKVEADEFAYVKNLFSVRVTLSCEVPRAMTVPVKIKLGDEVAAHGSVAVRKGKGDYTVTLDLTPEKVGYAVYSVGVPLFDFEGEVADNRSDFAVKVIRDRIRVMHICGRPSWDGRFLRQTLKNDPAIDMVAFYILRNVSDYVNVGNDELSLIEFPYQQLFDRELHTFDLVIFQNFSYRTFFSPALMENLRKFVENGGGFLMLGGDLSFSEGGYQGTALEGILPYRLDNRNREAAGKTFRLQQTLSGKYHPITDGMSDAGRFSMEGLNALGAALSGTQTLLATEEGTPFLGIREVGKGRSAAVSGDGFWMLHFPGVGAGLGNRTHQELVRRLVRWLVKDPAVSTLSFSGLKAEYPANDSISFSLKSASTVRKRTLSVKLMDARGRIVSTKKAVVDTSGLCPVEFSNPGKGVYVVRAENSGEGAGADYASEAFSISFRNEYGSTNESLLRKLADESNGCVIEYSEKSLADRIDAPSLFESRVIERHVYPIWNSRPALVIIVLLFGLEWFIRKRNGLL